MISLAAVRTHRNNIHRYRRSLETQIAGLEREDVERGLSDERYAMDAPVSAMFPVRFECVVRIGSSDMNLSRWRSSPWDLPGQRSNRRRRVHLR
ncbi:hypothetical protein [Bradyrhizobium ottawaense]|uniref:hypothetical protein n=1 Tax=Bradyrhizobium ottawaense TaxID=931866 RepID=UPI001178A9D2|nr:hypothetical protein [Bradyrhizobium ottawaense]